MLIPMAYFILIIELRKVAESSTKLVFTECIDWDSEFGVGGFEIGQQILHLLTFNSVLLF